MLHGSPIAAADSSSASSPCPSCGAPTSGRPGPWLQINATPSAPEVALLAGLGPEIAVWRAAGAGCVWLLRKDPGLRLRLDGGLDVADVRPGLERLLDAGLIASWFPSIYEPEVHQFGGPAAMAAVHTYFDADTRALLLGSQATGRRVTNAVLSLGILNDLFLRSLGAREEVWDVWCNLQALYRGHGHPGAAIPAIDLAGLNAIAGPAELETVALYDDANRRLAAALDAIWRQGALQCGRRSILPYVAVFHWNRHGVGVERMATLSDAMALAWNPKRGMRGAAKEAFPA